MDECFRCHERGHFARECPIASNGDNYRSRGTAPRGGRGTFRGSGRGGEGMARPRVTCYRCNRVGHMARNCFEGLDTCYRCNLRGHIARDCGNSRLVNFGGSGGGGNCYNCGRAGHLARDCHEADQGRYVATAGPIDCCYNCGRPGHIARACPGKYNDGDGRGGSRDNRKCYKCGRIGHISRDCRQVSDDDKKCYKCGEPGHLARACPLQSTDEGGCGLASPVTKPPAEGGVSAHGSDDEEDEQAAKAAAKREADESDEEDDDEAKGENEKAVNSKEEDD